MWVTNHKLQEWTKFRENLHKIDWITTTDHETEVIHLFLSEKLKSRRVKKEETEVKRNMVQNGRTNSDSCFLSLKLCKGSYFNL